MAPSIRIVATDANILINLVHVDALSLLARLAGSGWEFVLCDEVIGEVLGVEQRQKVEELLLRGEVRREALDLEELRIYAHLTTFMGSGEAACLALAEKRGWLLGSDERGALAREAGARLGKNKILTTPGLIVLAIRAGLLTVAEADEMKRALEGHRFKMRFASFADVVGK